jgi:amino acid transporter
MTYRVLIIICLLLLSQERAFDIFFIPWAICTINAIIWSILVYVYQDMLYLEVDTIRSMYNLVLTTALAFLLVFRLNRVAVRWWDTRTMWGAIVADARILASCILEHVSFYKFFIYYYNVDVHISFKREEI